MLPLQVFAVVLVPHDQTPFGFRNDRRQHFNKLYLFYDK